MARKLKDRTKEITEPIAEKYEESKEKLYKKVKEARDSAAEEKARADAKYGTYSEQLEDLKRQAMEAYEHTKDATKEKVDDLKERVEHKVKENVGNVSRQ